MKRDDEPDLEWDERKSAWNRQQRGFGFELAYKFDFASAVIVEDRRKDYGERRYRAAGRIEGLPYMVVFTPRNGRIRIISMRRMHEKEAKAYGI